MKIENKDCFEYLETLKDNSINLFLMDPPFAIGEQNFGSQYHRKQENIINSYFAIPSDNYHIFMTSLLLKCIPKLKNNGSILIFCSWNKLYEMLYAVSKCALKVINHLIWHYNFGVYTKHKFVCSHYHLLWLAKRGHKPYFNQFGVHNNTKEAYQDLQDVLIFKKEFQHGGKKNINKLPSKLVEHLIKLTTKQGDVVCDLFAGSFIVPKVAEQLKREGIGCEINPNCFKNEKDN